MRDRASVNNVAIRTLKVVYPLTVGVGCFHTQSTMLEAALILQLRTNSSLCGSVFFSHSPKTRLLWKSKTGRSMSSYSATRWWSKWEVIKQVLVYFGAFFDWKWRCWSSTLANITCFFQWPADQVQASKWNSSNSGLGGALCQGVLPPWRWRSTCSKVVRNNWPNLSISRHRKHT